MASMLIQINVKDFAEWKKVFETADAFRKSNGEISHQIYRDVSNLNKVTALYKWNSLANAQKFAQSPELKTFMEKAGVAGPPVVFYLNEA